MPGLSVVDIQMNGRATLWAALFWSLESARRAVLGGQDGAQFEFCFLGHRRRLKPEILDGGIGILSRGGDRQRVGAAEGAR